MKAKSEFEIGYHAIRNSVALEEEFDLRCLLITGSDAFNVLNSVCPCDVYLQNGQIKHTLLLDDEGIPFADVYACRDWENAYLLGYGPNSKFIINWIKQHSGNLRNYAIVDLMESHRAITLNGPYAWELCAEVVGSYILGLPYLSMSTLNNLIVFRAGMTGEFGYHILIPSEHKSNWLAVLVEKGALFDLKMADSQARSQCSLENFFFDLIKEGSYGLTPMELQLQWRISMQKEVYPGYEAIHTIRKNGWNRRLCAFITPYPINVDEVITCEDTSVGRVLAIGYSPLRKEFVGKALLDRPFWHAGLDCFRVGDHSLITKSAPIINNLSISINPYLNSYLNRNEVEK